MISMRERWPDALSLRFLEAHAGQAAPFDGHTYTKTVPFAILVQAHTGHYRVGVGGRWAVGSPETFLCSPPNIPVTIEHHYDDAPLMIGRWVHVSFSLWGALDPFWLMDLPVELDGDAAERAGGCASRLLAARERHPIVRLAEHVEIGHTLFATLAAASVPKPGADEIIDGAARLGPLLRTMQENLSDDFDVERLADLAHVSPATLHRRFVGLFRVSPMRYLKGLRLDEAARRLQRGDESQASLALAVGFANPFHFSREFARRYGVPPSEYRRRAREHGA